MELLTLREEASTDLAATNPESAAVGEAQAESVDPFMRGDVGMPVGWRSCRARAADHIGCPVKDVMLL